MPSACRPPATALRHGPVALPGRALSVVALSVLALVAGALVVVALPAVDRSVVALSAGAGPVATAPGGHLLADAAAARVADARVTAPVSAARADRGSPVLTGGVVAPTAVRVSAVPARADPEEAEVGGYRAPVDGVPRLVRAFDPPPQPWMAGHRGVDVAAGPGTTVRAPRAGTVTFAGDVAGRGVVTVLHDDGLRSSLEPLAVEVGKGARVDAGQALGTLAGDAHGGTPGGPALHWGVRDGDRYVDPWDLLPGHGPVVLLPLR